jgi:large subunit ribosomal protein L6
MRKKINIQSKFKKIRISGQDLSLYSTYNQILNNLFYGVLVGHSKYLELKGVGFKFKLKNNKLFLILGYSHVISYVLPSNISVELLNTKLIKLFSNNLMILNKVIFYLKKLKKTDVYKGKGILLKGEVVLIKEGKKSNTF